MKDKPIAVHPKIFQLMVDKKIITKEGKWIYAKQSRIHR